MGFNGMRVGISVVALVALGLTLAFPWWRYRADADLERAYWDYQPVARLLQESGRPMGTEKVLETHVGVVSVWAISGYEVHDWLPVNVVQLVGIVALWAWALGYARRFEGGVPVTVTVTKTLHSTP